MIEQVVQGWRPYGLLMLLCLGLYLPGLASLPVTDRDEARFAQATRQMLETRDFIAIRFQDEARNKKPAGIYWLQAASVALLSTADSTAIWPYRLPSLLGATAASLATFGMGAALVGRKAAFLGAALLAASLGVVIEAHLAKTDAALLACVTMAQLALGRIYLAARESRVVDWRFALLFWVALAVGILIKGPIVPLVAALTAGALSIADRDYRWLASLRPLRGAILTAAIVLPWVIAISSATGGAFLSDSLGQDFFGKLIGAQESHGAPPLYYLLLLTITFWPGSLFLGPAITWCWQQRHAVAARFLIAWALPFWIVMELVPTKLPNYLLPAYPALALAIGGALIAAGDGKQLSWRWPDRIVTMLWAATTLGLAAALLIAPMTYGRGLIGAGVVAAMIALLFGARLVIAIWRGSAPELGIHATILALLVLSLCFTFVVPRFDRLWLSRDAARLVAEYGPPKDVAVVATGYAEPSLVFMLGTNTLFAAADRAAEQLTTARGALALVEGHEDAAFRAGLAARGWAPREIGKVSGFDYSNGRAMVLTLYAGAPR
jgi:4-amino-4-deoxy-L-arabinose transferase-like glycosyltransferase